VSHLLTLAPRVAEEGVDVHVLCFTDEVAEEFRRRGVPATVVPVRHKLDLIGAGRLWPHLEHADVVHTHDRRAGLLARPQGRLRGAHVVHTLHGLPEEIATWVGHRGARVDQLGGSQERPRRGARFGRLVSSGTSAWPPAQP
jgi:hypothetical protein